MTTDLWAFLRRAEPRSDSRVTSRIFATVVSTAGLVVAGRAACAQPDANPPASKPSGVDSPAKRPIPTRQAHEEADRAFQQAFSGDVRKAASSVQLIELAKRLNRLASECDDPAERYVLLGHAKQLAIKAADAETALSIVDDIVRTFEVDGLAETHAAILELSKGISNQSGAAKTLVNRSVAVVEAAIAEDRFSLAESALNLAKTVAPRAKDKSLPTRLNALASDVKSLAEAYEKIKPQLAKLETKPEDAEANSAVGEYRCFLKGEWSRGLSSLALGKDESLAKLAKQDFDNPQDAQLQVVIADGWWTRAEKAKGRAHHHLRQRAVLWYARAVSKLSGLTKARAENRLKEVDAAQPAIGSIPNLPSTYLADLKPESIRVFGGRNGQVATPAVAPKVIREPFVLNGRKAEHGLFAHPPANRSSSMISYSLAKGFTVLSGTAGVVDGLPKNPASPLTFRIVGDGKALWQSEPLTKPGQSVAFGVDVTGVDRLELYVDCPGRNQLAAAAWLDPILRWPIERTSVRKEPEKP